MAKRKTRRARAERRSKLSEAKRMESADVNQRKSLPDFKLLVSRNWCRFPLPWEKQPCYQAWLDFASTQEYPTNTSTDDYLLGYAKEFYDQRELDRTSVFSRMKDMIGFQVAMIAGQLTFVQWIADAKLVWTWQVIMIVAGTGFMLLAVAIAAICYAVPLKSHRPFPMDIEMMVGASPQRYKINMARNYFLASTAICYNIERTTYFAHASLWISIVALCVFTIGALLLRLN